MWAGILRHALTTFGGGLLTSGYLSASELEQAVGALVTLVGIALSVVSKRRLA